MVVWFQTVAVLFSSRFSVILLFIYTFSLCKNKVGGEVIM